MGEVDGEMEVEEAREELKRMAVEAARLATEDIQDDLREFDLMQEESAEVLKNENGVVL